MQNTTLDAIEINPSQPAQATVIWLHGLGADGHDFESIVPELGLSPALATRFIFPHAPIRPITINGGMKMRGWYDIKGFSLPLQEDEPGIQASSRTIESLISTELNRGIEARKIILAGFSQGGAIALHCGLRYPLRLGGILALSTYLPLASRVPQEIHSANRDIPIFMAHGQQDPLLPIAMAEMSKAALNSHGYKVDWHTYSMPHSVCPQEIKDIGNWLMHTLR